jgi:ankyrin repeat protein
MNNDLSEAKRLIAAGADIDVRGHDGCTALTYAAHYGHAGICAFLARNGADVDARDKQGRTPLIDAAAKGNYDACKALIENGAQVNAG